MKSQDLKELQQRIKFDAITLAKCLGISHDQTRKYLCGQTTIPTEIERAALELEHVEKQLDAQRLANFEAKLSRSFPYGIGEKIKLQPEPIGGW